MTKLSNEVISIQTLNYDYLYTCLWKFKSVVFNAPLFISLKKGEIEFYTSVDFVFLLYAFGTLMSTFFSILVFHYLNEKKVKWLHTTSRKVHIKIYTPYHYRAKHCRIKKIKCENNLNLKEKVLLDFFSFFSLFAWELSLNRQD